MRFWFNLQCVGKAQISGRSGIYYLRYDGLSSGGGRGLFCLLANRGSEFNLKEWLEAPQGVLCPHRVGFGHRGNNSKQALKRGYRPALCLFPAETLRLEKGVSLCRKNSDPTLSYCIYLSTRLCQHKNTNGLISFPLGCNEAACSGETEDMCHAQVIFDFLLFKIP